MGASYHKGAQGVSSSRKGYGHLQEKVIYDYNLNIQNEANTNVSEK